MNEGNERGRPPRSIAPCAKLHFLVLLLTNKEMLKGVLKKKLILRTFPMEEMMADGTHLLISLLIF